MSCRDKHTFEVALNNVDSTFLTIPLGDGKTEFATTFKMDIISNSINDTILIGKHKVLPNFKGNIISLHDYYEPNYKFSVKTCKRKKGKLIFSYYY